MISIVSYPKFRKRPRSVQDATDKRPKPKSAKASQPRVEGIREINPTVICDFLKPFEDYLRSRELEVKALSRFRIVQRSGNMMRQILIQSTT